MQPISASGQSHPDELGKLGRIGRRSQDLNLRAVGFQRTSHYGGRIQRVVTISVPRFSVKIVIMVGFSVSSRSR